MAVRIVKRELKDQNVEFSIILQIIERNRDRVRATGNMVLTVSGIIVSATVGITLFTLNQNLPDLAKVIVRVVFPIAIILSVTSIYFGVAASLLRVSYSVTTQLAILSSLMRLFESELRKVTLAFRLLMLSLATIVLGIIAIVGLASFR